MRLDHLLEVVEQEEQLALGDVLGEAVLGAERLGDRLDDERRVAERGEPDPEDAVPCSRRRAPRLPRSRAASCPSARPRERHEPRAVAMQRDDLLHSRSRPTKELAGRGRFVFEIVLSGGKLPSPSW